MKKIGLGKDAKILLIILCAGALLYCLLVGMIKVYDVVLLPNYAQDIGMVAPV